VRGGWLALAAAAFLVPVNPVPAQPVDAAPTLVSRAGIRLPVQLCTMRQERLDTSSTRIDATYSLAGDGSLRISVARAAQPVDAEFLDIERAIGDYFGDIVMLRDLPAPPGARARVWRGILDGRRVMTGLWLWHHGGQRIRLRGTVPLGDAERLWPEIECAVRTLHAPATSE
jgi:hypothetical protein